jgi:hypothetical protein
LLIPFLTAPKLVINKHVLLEVDNINLSYCWENTAKKTLQK